jgi:hypothetical protein
MMTMTPRSRLLAATYVMLLLYVASDGNALFDSILDVFAGLGALLVLSVLALWPGSGRPEQVEDALGRRSWADRVRLAKGTESKDDV